jgi:type IV secretion system protein VirB10
MLLCPRLSRARLCQTIWLAGFLVLPAGYGQESAEAPQSQATPATPAAPLPAPFTPASYTIETGTRIPLALISSVSSKSSSAGDRIYLETAFPIVTGNRIVIPTGSYVTGTVTEVKRPGRVKGRGQLFVRFDSITLPNGVTREFRSRLGSVDSRSGEKLDPKEGQVIADSNKGGDAKTVATGGMGGASIGAIVGSAAGHAGMGAGVGGAAGVAAGMAGVLLTRGPDAELTKGSTIEMVLDRPLTFVAEEVNFTGTSPGHYADGPEPQPNRNRNSGPPAMRRPY